MNDIQRKILKLWETNTTAAEIAVELHMSRNAVMGHLYRMRMAGVKMRGNPSKIGRIAPPAPRPIGIKKMIRRAPAPIKPTIEEIRKEVSLTPSGKPVSLFELKPKSCRFVVSGESSGNVLFCNEEKKDGSSYCPHHHSICYVAKSSIRDLNKKAKSDDATA